MKKSELVTEDMSKEYLTYDRLPIALKAICRIRDTADTKWTSFIKKDKKEKMVSLVYMLAGAIDTFGMLALVYSIYYKMFIEVIG